MFLCFRSQFGLVLDPQEMKATGPQNYTINNQAHFLATGYSPRANSNSVSFRGTDPGGKGPQPPPYEEMQRKKSRPLGHVLRRRIPSLPNVRLSCILFKFPLASHFVVSFDFLYQKPSKPSISREALLRGSKPVCLNRFTYLGRFCKNLG